MNKVPLKNPEPNFGEFKRILKGRKEAKRVHFVELFPDPEVVSSMAKMLGQKPVSFSFLSMSASEPFEVKKAFMKQWINWWYRMGYDYVTAIGPIFSGLEFPAKARKTKDTASLPRRERSWVEEGTGIISSWEDFEKYPWPSPNKVNYSLYEFIVKNLPEGMEMMVCPSSGVFEISSESLLGFEGLSYLLYDKPALVEAVFNKVGEILCTFYENIADLEGIGGFFQGDDMGFTTSTIISPANLRKLVLPWHKKFASIAHQHNKMYWLHCCGNIRALMEDFINDVKIDALHSFEDACCPVIECKKRYGDRIAILGGVDMDKLCRLDEENLRDYVRKILDECMPGGRYALGSGNSIANYVPIKNYLIMLDEGLRWGYLQGG